MKCCSCGIEINKAFKAAISKNVCPACSKPILASGNLTAFVPLCELIASAFTVSAQVKQQDQGQGVVAIGSSTAADQKEADVEALATLIISTFNVRVKGEKEEAQVQAETNPDAEYKQKQMTDAKATLQKMREEAYNEALRGQWDMQPGEEKLDPDVGEALVNGMLPQEPPDAGQAMVVQKQNVAYQKMISGAGKVKRGG